MAMKRGKGIVDTKIADPRYFYEELKSSKN